MLTHKRLFAHERKARTLFILAILAGSLAAASFVFLVYLLSEVISRVFLKNQALSDVLPALYLMLALLVIRGCAIWSREALTQHSAGLLKTDLRRRLTDHLFRLGPLYARAERSGELVNTMVEAVESLDAFITQYLPAQALAVIIPAFIFLVVLFLDPWTTLVFVVVMPMMLLILALIGGRAKAITERRFIEMSWMSAFFLDLLQGLPTLKMFGRSDEQARNIREISSQYASTTMEVLHTAFQSSMVMEWAATAATAMVALEVSLRLMNGSLPFTTALTVLLLTPEFFLPVRQFAMRFHTGTAGKAAADRIFVILDTPPKDQKIAIIPANFQIPQRLDIHFEQVGFAYEDSERPALSDFSMTLRQGQMLALVGPTGAGKTTVSRLLLRFAYPDSGRIMIGDVPLNRIDEAAWREQVAWVPQHPYLFHGTIAENIGLGRPNASQKAIIAAAKAAHADEFITSFPQGYQTQVGERGTRLSGGQLQRIAIARAFLKDAPVLILDEPTAHLDSGSEEKIQTALRRLIGGRSVLIITHRLNLAVEVDQILVMGEGRVLEMGDPSELQARNGAFSRLMETFNGKPGWGGTA